MSAKKEAKGTTKEKTTTTTTGGIPKSIQQSGTGVRLVARVKPNAKESRIEGIDDDAVSVAVAEIAQDGRANTALVEFLAEALGVKKRDVTLERGAKSHDKSISVSGITASQTFQRISSAIPK